MVGTSLTSNLWICHCESLALSEHHSPGCICKFPTTRRSERCLLGLAACADQAKHLLHDRINRANKADSQFLRACYFLFQEEITVILYHIMADTGCLPDDVIPQIPTNRMKGEDQEIPRICLGHTLDDCLTSIGIAHFVSKFLPAR